MSSTRCRYSKKIAIHFQKVFTLEFVNHKVIRNNREKQFGALFVFMPKLLKSKTKTKPETDKSSDFSCLFFNFITFCVNRKVVPTFYCSHSEVRNSFLGYWKFTCNSINEFDLIVIRFSSTDHQIANYSI